MVNCVLNHRQCKETGTERHHPIITIITNRIIEQSQYSHTHQMKVIGSLRYENNLKNVDIRKNKDDPKEVYNTKNQGIHENREDPKNFICPFV